MLVATKRLQSTKLYEEHEKLSHYYYKMSLKKEHKQQKYLSSFFLKNEGTSKSFKINYNFSTYYKKYTKTIEQKIYCIEELAKEKGLVPVFVTFTLPSNYHPFLSIPYKNKRLYTDINSNFNFQDIETSIMNGYQYLNNVYRTLYKRIKNSVDTLYYIKVVEMHKTLIPHFHILFYIKKEFLLIFKKKYDKIKTEFKLNQTDFDIVQYEKKELKGGVKTTINRASKYIMKYILKSLKNGQDFFQARLIDGWKRVCKIRIITSSNLKLSLADYRVIYYNLESSEKDKLLEKAKSSNKSIFYYILKNISIITVVNLNKQSLIKKFSVNENSSLILFKTITKIKRNGAYYSKIDKLTIYIDNKLVYEKPKYTWSY